MNVKLCRLLLSSWGATVGRGRLVGHPCFILSPYFCHVYVVDIIWLFRHLAKIILLIVESILYEKLSLKKLVISDIITGKLDQKNSQLEVDYAIGRDIRPGDVNVIVNCLQDWCSACEGVLACVESQIHRANSQKNKCVQRKADIEQEVHLF